MKRFKATGTNPVRLATLDGHVSWVGTEWTDLHERHHSEAYSAGCISEDMIKNTASKGIDPSVVNTMNNIALQKNEVETAIRKLVEDNDLESFDSKGKPKSTVLSQMVGFRVTNSIRDEVWHRVQENDIN